MVRNFTRSFISRPCLYAMLALMAVIVGAAALTFTRKVDASSPTSGTLNPTVGNTLQWVGTKSAGGAATPAANGEPSCTARDATATNCDVFTLIVPPGAWAGKHIDVKFTWAIDSNDYDMTVRREENGVPGMQGDGIQCTQATPCEDSDPIVGTSGNGATNLTLKVEEVLLAPPDSGATYYVRAIYFAAQAAPADEYQGKATVFSANGVAPPVSAAAKPTFDNYQPLDAAYPRRDDSPEPSIGVNWNTGNVMTMSRLQCNRTVFDDSTSPANPNTTKWFPQALPAAITGLDPILWTDPQTGRTICGELQGAFGATNGIITDDDLTTATPEFATGVTNGQDHQTIGSGPPNRNIANRQPNAGVPNLWYYASQAVATATVATSFDGGVTFQPAVPAYTFQQCGGLHGHVKVAADGTVYVPNRGCQGKVGLATSFDNGLNWTVQTIPTSTSGGSDPSVGIGAGGRLYVGYTDGAEHPHVAVSDDRGATWRNDYDFALALTPNLTAAAFPQAVAGDNDRAAIFFLGTTSTNPGDPVGTDNGGAGPNFAGTWYPYIATTADGGLTWNVTRADNDPLHPGVKNPAQQGVICLIGTTCPGPTTSPGTIDTRNLADFNEVTVDPRGRVTAVYADGCNFDHSCITLPDNDPTATRINNQGVARLTILRQRGGMRLFKEFESGSPTAPLSPFVEATAESGRAVVLWGTPDDGGSPITQYRVYRQPQGGTETLVTTLPAGTNTYTDPNGRPGSVYRVSAVNKYGESPKGKPAVAQKPGKKVSSKRRARRSK
jgi:hypothetical protein